MRRKRRLLALIGGMVGIIALTTAVVRLYVRPTRWPNHIVAVSPVIAEPLMAANGQPLTRWADRRALLVNPLQLSGHALSAVQRTMGVRRIGKRPVLWLTSVANQEHLGHTAGIEAVWARVLVPDNGLSLDTLQALAKASRDWTRGSWNWSRGQYQLGRIRTGLQSTVNGGLTTDLKEVWSGSGTALIVNSRGAMVALAAGSEQSLWARHAIGQALLPPMLALAVTVPAVRKALEQPHSELTGVALAWGTDDVRRGLQTLGVTVDATRRWRKPSTQMIMDSLSQGSSLTATPLQLAQSYLPFVSGGRIGPVWVRQTRPPLGHTIDGEFGRVLQQLPAVTLAGTRFRVWRPVGSYAIVIAPKQHQIAILEGDWVNAAVSVMQVMANGHQPSLPSGR